MINSNKADDMLPLQTGLNLCKMAVEADNQKNYALASNLYEQAILNLKLAIISERDAHKTSVISSKIDEYSQRNKYIKNLIQAQPLQSSPQQNSGGTAFNFPSVPSLISPSIANQTMSGSTGMGFPAVNASNGHLSPPQSFPSPPVLGGSGMGINGSQDSISKLHSLNSISNADSGREVNSKLNRVEAYEIAKNLSKKGIREEELKNYRGASNYYEQSCSHFLVAIRNEPDPIMKKSMQEEAKIFLDRIELLKPYVQFQNAQQPQQVAQQPLLPSQPLQSSTQMMNSSFNSSSSSISMNNSNITPMNMFPSTSTMNMNNNPQNFAMLPPQQQMFIQQRQQQMSNGGTNLGMIPTGAFSPDKCAACGVVLATNSIKALDRSWHPECFSVSIVCAGCQKPFTLVNLSLKVKDGKAYHPMCFESTSGLYQEENKTFVGTSKTLFFSIQLQRKFYKAGETIQFAFVIDNATSKKVDKVVAYLLMSENRMEIIGTTYERRSKKSVKKLGRCEFNSSNRFPLVKDRFEGDFFFQLPPNLLPSETSGVDASFVREYQLVVKCVGPPLKVMTVKLRFNLNILDK